MKRVLKLLWLYHVVNLVQNKEWEEQGEYQMENVIEYIQNKPITICQIDYHHNYLELILQMYF
jgi:hypothetical protein